MKTINDQISPDFVAQARKLTFYTGLLREVLPVECIDHVQVANVRDQNLMLITDSPVWTTRLRQLSPQILQHIREHSPKYSNQSDSNAVIHHVQISTRYQSSSEEAAASAASKHRQPPSVSNKTAEILKQSADSISDPRLKKALLNIASHTK